MLIPIPSAAMFMYIFVAPFCGIVQIILLVLKIVFASQKAPQKIPIPSILDNNT